MSTPVLFKVNTKKSKKEPCRICNTKTRPCIDMMKNKELLETVNAALGLVVSSDSRLSKSVCVVCMSLVRLFEEFKKVCYDNQNDLWIKEQHLVKDRGSEVVDLLLRAKNTAIPGHQDTPKSSVVVEPDLNYIPAMKKERYEAVIEEETVPDAGEMNEIYLENEMIEEHLEDPSNIETENLTIRFMCQQVNCDRIFDTKEELEKHQITHKLVRVRTKPYNSVSRRRNQTLKQDAYSCQVCMKVFDDIAGLVQHRKLNHLSKKCGFCGLAMPTETFVAHQGQCRREHAKKAGLLELNKKGGTLKELPLLPPDTPLYKCGRCGAKFKTVDTYKKHSKECARRDS
ncbi:uncharacterized protein LOC134831992 [Culicoides brevitarsis]|uniref:uncharacterized protein LOC134831992 n=1 Tax=Culicoides brevitarsis TaxID=469753 RepID=UPI00307B579A